MTGRQAKNLVGWGELVELERTGKETKLADLIVQPEQMFPAQPDFDRTRMHKKVREGLKQLLKERIPDPNLRRSMQAKLLKHGKIRPEAFAILRDQHANIVSDLQNDMPDALPLMEAGGFYDFLLGKVSEGEFTKNFQRALLHPAALGRMASHADMESLWEFAKFFWQQTEEISQPISRLIQKLVAAQLSAAPFDYRRVRDSMEKAAKLHENRCAVVSKLANVELSSQEIDRMPGTRLFIDVFWEYVFEKMDRFANLRSNDFAKAVVLKRGDFADLTHILYCPYVDIFGCDGEMKARIRRAGWPTEKIVANDRELTQALAKFTMLAG